MKNYVLMRDKLGTILKVECYSIESVTTTELGEKIKEYDSEKHERYPELINDEKLVEVLDYLYPMTEDQVTDESLNNEIQRLTSIIENIKDETWRL